MTLLQLAERANALVIEAKEKHHANPDEVEVIIEANDDGILEIGAIVLKDEEEILMGVIEAV